MALTARFCRFQYISRKEVGRLVDPSPLFLLSYDSLGATPPQAGWTQFRSSPYPEGEGGELDYVLPCLGGGVDLGEASDVFRARAEEGSKDLLCVAKVELAGPRILRRSETLPA